MTPLVYLGAVALVCGAAATMGAKHAIPALLEAATLGAFVLAIAVVFGG